MVRIEHRHALGDVGDREHAPVFTVRACRFDAQADRHVFAEFLEAGQHDQFRVVLTECFFRLELQFNLRADLLAGQRFLDPRENVVVAMQVDQRCVRLLEHVALRVVHRHIEADQCAVGDLHRRLRDAPIMLCRAFL